MFRENISLEIPKDPLIEEMKNELTEPGTVGDSRHLLTGLRVNDHLMYTLYFLFIGISPLIVIQIHKLINSYFLSLVAFIVIGGVVSNLFSVWRIDRRIAFKEKGRESRRAAMRFLFFQLLLVQVSFLIVVATGHLLFSSQIIVTVYGKRIDLYLLLLFGLGFYLYTTVLNSKPITWYLTGQPFWMPTKDILIVPLAKTKKFLSLYRLLLWSVAGSVIFAYFYYPELLYYYWIGAQTVIFIMGQRYKYLDFKFTVNISLEVNTRLQNSIPRPVETGDEDEPFDHSQRDINLTTSPNRYNSAVRSLYTRVVVNRDADTEISGYRQSYSNHLNESEPVNTRAKQTVNRLIQEVIQQRERINQLYEESLQS